MLQQLRGVKLMSELQKTPRRLYGLATLAGAATALVISFSAVRMGEVGAAPSSPAVVFETPQTTRSFADVVEQVSPAVVNIAVTKEAQTLPTTMFRGQRPGGNNTPYDEFFERFFGAPGMVPRESRPMRGLGSGFLIDESGYIVTNNHVIEGASNVVVLLEDGKELDATLVGTDPNTDLALLKVESDEPLPALAFGNSDEARVGDWVLAIGNPFGLGGSATAGIISARGRDIRSGPYDDYMQIDAPINSGNSGGPIFNAAGEVIGVNTAIFSPNGGNVGIGFAIPAKVALSVVDELRASGSVKRGWLGVQIQDINDELAASFGLEKATGALVGDVVEGSPAAQAGIKVGDVIVTFDGKDVDTAKALSLAVAAADPADKVPLRVLRDGKGKSLHVTLGEAEQQQARTSFGGNKESEPASELGLSLAELTDIYRQRLGLPDDVKGVLITEVQPGSDAAEQGLRPGDVVSRIGSSRIENIDDAMRAINEARSRGDRAALLVRRNDGQQYVSVAFS
jgi:serine protease Do